MLSLTPPASAETYTYDAAGRLTGVTYDDGSAIAYRYDANGNRLARAVTDSGDPSNEVADNSRKSGGTGALGGAVLLILLLGTGLGCMRKAVKSGGRGVSIFWPSDS
ncbi:MAG TPA: hypothetical protein ENJ19_00820 [Gammaproteobacteria bacterium]|nr:hypothetical protein [Gammaproteobacteria bacterium]